MPPRYFLSYSCIDAVDFATRLHGELEKGQPPALVWFDRNSLRPGTDWDRQIVDALKECEAMLFVLSRDSVTDQSVCKNEWTRVLAYKKPIVPMMLHTDAEMPFRLGSRQFIDFTGEWEPALARLNTHLRWLASPAGVLAALKDRLADARRDATRSLDEVQRKRVEDDINHLERQVAEQDRVVTDPEGAARRLEESITRGLERERQPARPASGATFSRFINPPPMQAPGYFQDRHVETGLIGDFFRDGSKRLMTVVGRGGVGKTTLVCRILKALEGGRLPDDGGPLQVDGIVYLSAVGSRRVNVPNLFNDLCRLLPEEVVTSLVEVYKSPQSSIEAKMQALLGAFPAGLTVVLLDNFEDLVDQVTFRLSDAELDEALRAALRLPQHGVKFLVTTRVAPRALALFQPARQVRLDLDEGLPSPFAENILRAMDADGKVGLMAAPDDLLTRARERTRGYPRALEALFAILSADRNTSLAEVLDDAARRLPENVVEDLVGEAFSRLDPVAEKVMESLAVYGLPVTPTAIDYLLKPYQQGVDSSPVLGRLVHMHFARKEAGRYYLHPVDREYAQSQIPIGSEADRTQTSPPAFSQFALRHRAADYFQQARVPRAEWKTIDDLSAQLAEFELRFEGREFEVTTSILIQVEECLLRWGHSRRLVGLRERLLEVISDPFGKMQNVLSLATAHYRIGQLTRALDLSQHGLALVRESNFGKPDEARFLGISGLCFKSLGQIDRAIECHEEAITLSREASDSEEELINLVNLGICQWSAGRVTRAIECYKQSLVRLDARRDVYYQEAINHNLGLCYYQIGQTTKAIDLYEVALEMNRETGDRDFGANHRVALAACRARLGHFKEALGEYEAVLAVRQAIEDPEGECTDLDGCASVLIDLGRLEEAATRAAAAVRIGGEIGVPLGDRYQTLALAHACCGDLDAARAAIAAALPDADRLGQHEVLALAGVIELRLGDRAAAQARFAEAEAAADALLAKDGRHFAALDSKALALGGLQLCAEGGRLQAARDAFAQARTLNSDPGVVARAARLFDLLAPADPEGRLGTIRPAALGAAGPSR